MAEPLLKRKVAVVIGASRNLGRAIAEMLGAEGAAVAVHYNSVNARAGAEETAASIKANGGKASVMQADLTRVAEVEHLFDSVARRFGHLDIMVNTAGMVLKKALAEITEQEYDRLFAINSKAAFFCMQAAANQMSDNGRIVNIGTSLLAATTGFYSAYAGSKAPLEHFTRALAKEVGSRGITVNTVAPGPLNTSFFYPPETDDATEFHKSMSINGKLGEVKDIVPLVKLLVSPEGCWITAQTIFINGGYVAR
jgi:NAD(P)-dependent dehydrogenase (short-subunit alcohol dehydrogenase family)